MVTVDRARASGEDHRAFDDIAKLAHVARPRVRLPPAPRWGAYTASKSAFDTWMRAARPALRLHGIDCTSVYLGLVHTRMSAPTEPPPAMFAPAPGAPGDLRADVEDFERKRIEQALAEARGNQTRAAELLGISRRTLVSRLDAFGMPRPRKNRLE